MFRSRVVAGANVTQLLLIAGMFGFLFFSTQYLQISLGFKALNAGLGMLPVAVSIGAVSLGLSARLNAKFGERPMLLVGLALIVAGLALMGRAPAGGDYVVDVLPAMLLIGIGFGAAMPALMALGMSGATEEDAGLASGMFNTSQQIGGALGLSVLATLAAGHSDPTAGFHVAFLVAAGFVAAGFVLAGKTRERQRGGSRR
jgi:MFS family permease